MFLQILYLLEDVPLSSRDSLNAYIGQKDEKNVPLIEKQLLQSNPILESFGNAKTLRNNNSSRFGKYLRIVFGEKGHIIGGSIKHFLLEKSRLTDQLDGERSYHFFYQLCLGVPENMQKELWIDSPDKFKFLSDSNSHLIKHAYMGGASSSDEADFKAVDEAFKIVGVEQDIVTEIYKVVSAVLHLEIYALLKKMILIQLLERLFPGLNLVANEVFKQFALCSAFIKKTLWSL